MKFKLIRFALLLSVTSTATLLTGCKSIDQGPFTNFAISSDSVSSSAKVAYDLLAKTGTDSALQTLITSTNPPYWYPDNRRILLGKSFIPAESLQERAKVTAALSAYARALANMVSDPAQKQFDTSTAGLAQSLQNFDSGNVTNLFGKNLSNVLPTADQINAFSGAVKMIGDLILEAETKHDVKQILKQGSPAILCLTTNLENDIGITNTSGMRAYFHDHYDDLLADGYGQMTWKTDNGATQQWTDLPTADRQKMVQAALALANQMQTTDELLVTLRDSYGKFRQAHEALKGVIDQSQQFSLSSALSTFNEAAQQLDQIVNSLKTAPPK